MRRAFVLCALLAGGACAARAEGTGSDGSVRAPTVAIAAEVTSEGSRTRLAVSLSAPVAATASLMERPERVVIDLPEVNFQLPADAGGRREGLVASFRGGLFAPGRSRVVIDLAQPALVSRLETVAGADGAATLVIELTRADKDAFRAAASASARAGAPEPPPAAAGPREDRRPLIVLDPGHGGVDPGAATAGGVLEKDVVFAFAERLRERLEASGLYRVTMTRRHDVFVPLDERVRIARAAGADLLLSIHADSISAAPHVRGFTVYTGAERASDAESAKLAERENQADAAGGIDGGATTDEVADILQELTQRETRGFSKRAAAKLVGGLGAVMRLNAQPQREARFKVLRAADVPSVLVELGYLSSRKDIDLLTSASWRDRSTAAMAAAVDRFFAARVAGRGRTATAARR
jgi:N-acetylmuramoyl-L-alanine amidase